MKRPVHNKKFMPAAGAAIKPRTMKLYLPSLLMR